ncbi:MAG: heat shock protein HspQ [Rhodospirillales bacterium]|jgi:heat shock protein HspQ|nr:heat shock protein HspQ [Rhodospirillales bacterium]MDP6774321.1 heat shock protein HspQ [Rhodospirillales bacterium]
MNSDRANFSVGQLVTHRLFEYRGVVVDVDPHFLGGEDWYQQMAHTRPPKDRPWYHVLVDGAEYQTYVAERNLEADDSGAPIRHPLLGQYFEGLGEGHYMLRQKGN